MARALALRGAMVAQTFIFLRNTVLEPANLKINGVDKITRKKFHPNHKRFKE